MGYFFPFCEENISIFPDLNKLIQLESGLKTIETFSVSPTHSSVV